MADHHEAAGRLFQAGSRATPPEMVELRGLSPRRLIDVIDAISLARDKTRIDIVNEVLEAWVGKTLHEAMLVNRVLRGNGSDVDEPGTPADRGGGA